MDVRALTETEWTAAFDALPAEAREPYFHPMWAAAARRWEHAASAGCLAARSSAGGTMLYPYLAHALPYTAAAGAHDAQTPYGYGGPLFTGPWSAEERLAALGALGEALRERGAIAEFVRCHTEWCDAGELAAAAGYRAFQVRTNVECNLRPVDFTEGWAASARRNLRRAMSTGLTWRATAAGDPALEADLAHFARLYAATADRLAMAAHYRFDAGYARQVMTVPGARLVIVELPPTPGADADVATAVVAEGGSPRSHSPEPLAVAAAILLLGGRVAFYHLGASDFALQHLRPNDFLYFAMAAAARRHGCERIAWGGGMSNDPADTLFRFKTHFGDLRRPVFCAGRVLDEAAFAGQCAAWRDAHPGREATMFLRYRA